MSSVPRLVRRGLSAIVAAMTVVLLLPASAARASGGLPDSMASMGDSITRWRTRCRRASSVLEVDQARSSMDWQIRNRDQADRAAALVWPTCQRW